MLARRRNAAQHGVAQIAGRPAANAILWVLGDIRRDEVPERGFKPDTTDKNQPVVASRSGRRMAGGTAACPEYLFAPPGIAAFEFGQRCIIQRLRRTGEPEGRASGQRQHGQAQQKFAGTGHRGGFDGPSLHAIGFVAGAAIAGDGAEDRL